ANEAEVTFGFVDEFAIPERAVSAESRSIAQLFIDAKLVSSKSEARRLASQRGLTLNDEVVTSVDELVHPENGWILVRGKHDFAKLVVS
ncbi:MAG: hypothetical protein E6I60_13710, partial [Chloroflexi bacterium]